jgi:two-component system, LytTR family, sensor kinase
MKKIFSNFWTRNILFLLFILLLARINNDNGSFADFTFERFKVYLSCVIDYTWVLFHNKILVERYFLKKKVKEYFLLLPLSYLSYLPFFYAFYTANGISIGSALTAIMSLTAIKLLGLGLYFLIRYILHKERFYKASLNAKELEMQVLKGQLNPHFLFNALNNIYSHLITESKNGQELILKLSELMRYILDSNKKEYVSLGEELKFIDNYISFEKERLGERCEISLKTQVSDPGAKIAPLLLFTFIENAFKHGTQMIQKSVIEITITASENQVELFVTNPLNESSESSTKVGLINTKRRLELLYPEDHKIEINQVNNRYEVYLNINAVS